MELLFSRCITDLVHSFDVSNYWNVSHWQRLHAVTCQWAAAAVSLNCLGYHSTIVNYLNHTWWPTALSYWGGFFKGTPFLIIFSILFSGVQAAHSLSRISVTSRSTRATTSRMMPMPKMALRSSTNMRSASMRDACTAKPPTTSTASAQAAASPLPRPARWPLTNANTSAGTSAPLVSWASPPPSWHQRMSQRNQATMTWWTSRPSAARTPAWVPHPRPSSLLYRTCWLHLPLLSPPLHRAMPSSLHPHCPVQVNACPVCCPRPFPAICQWPSLFPTTPWLPPIRSSPSCLGCLSNHLHQLLASYQVYLLGPTPCPLTHWPKAAPQWGLKEPWHLPRPPLPPPPLWRRFQQAKVWYHLWWPDWLLLPWSPTTQRQVSHFTISFYSPLFKLVVGFWIPLLLL